MICKVTELICGLAESAQARWILAGSFLTITSCFSVQQSETIVTFRRSVPQLATSSNAIDLSVGDSAIVEVWARLRANHTKIRVKRGSKYRFVVPPGQNWTDWFIRTDANGYAHGPLPFITGSVRFNKGSPGRKLVLADRRCRQPGT